MRFQAPLVCGLGRDECSECTEQMNEFQLTENQCSRREVEKFCNVPNMHPQAGPPSLLMVLTTCGLSSNTWDLKLERLKFAIAGALGVKSSAVIIKDGHSDVAKDLWIATVQVAPQTADLRRCLAVAQTKQFDAEFVTNYLSIDSAAFDKGDKLKIAEETACITLSNPHLSEPIPLSIAPRAVEPKVAAAAQGVKEDQVDTSQWTMNHVAKVAHKNVRADLHLVHFAACVTQMTIFTHRYQQVRERSFFWCSC